MAHDWGQIYLYIATKTYRRWGKNEMPGDVAVDSLSDDQVSDLNRLKEWLYTKRTRQDLTGSELREGRERMKRQPRGRLSSRHCLSSRII